MKITIEDVGKPVILLKTISNYGGEMFRKGLKMQIRAIRRGKFVLSEYSQYHARSITGVPRGCFILLEDCLPCVQRKYLGKEV